MNGETGISRVRILVTLFVMVVIAILSAISIPAYQDYSVRSQVSEGIAGANELKTAVTEAYMTTGAWPSDIESLRPNLRPSSIRRVELEIVDRGTIVLVFGEDAGPGLAGNRLSHRPTVATTGDVVWSCGYAPDRGIDPPTGAAGPADTTVLAKYLPSGCR